MPGEAWADDELRRVGEAEELHLSSTRADGSFRSPVTMWVVRVDDDIYVRSVNGRNSSWFRDAQTRHEARISAGGIAKDVTLVETDNVLGEADTAYDAKYGGRYPSIVPSTIAREARAATLKLVPLVAPDLEREER
jgi:hypothetical protein